MSGADVYRLTAGINGPEWVSLYLGTVATGGGGVTGGGVTGIPPGGTTDPILGKASPKTTGTAAYGLVDVDLVPITVPDFNFFFRAGQNGARLTKRICYGRPAEVGGQPEIVATGCTLDRCAISATVPTAQVGQIGVVGGARASAKVVFIPTGSETSKTTFLYCDLRGNGRSGSINTNPTGANAQWYNKKINSATGKPYGYTASSGEWTSNKGAAIVGLTTSGAANFFYCNMSGTIDFNKVTDFCEYRGSYLWGNAKVWSSSLQAQNTSNGSDGLPAGTFTADPKTFYSHSDGLQITGLLRSKVIDCTIINITEDGKDGNAGFFIRAEPPSRTDTDNVTDLEIRGNHFCGGNFGINIGNYDVNTAPTTSYSLVRIGANTYGDFVVDGVTLWEASFNYGPVGVQSLTPTPALLTLPGITWEGKKTIAGVVTLTDQTWATTRDFTTGDGKKVRMVKGEPVYPLRLAA